MIIDRSSVSPTKYVAGGYTNKAKDLRRSVDQAKRIRHFPNGKVIEELCPKVALHELSRRAKGRAIEAENQKIAKCLFEMQSLIPQKRKMDKEWHKHN